MGNKREFEDEQFDIDKLNLNKSEDLFELISNTAKNKLYKIIRPAITNHIRKLVIDSGLEEKYNMIFLYDPNGSISEYTLNKIYKYVSGLNDKNILLLLHSSGGQVEASYLISKCLKDHSKKFITVIPRKAKSAATLLVMGSDEIHMGTISELGPIDPQVRKLPALGAENAIEYLASLTQEYPSASTMFSNYLSNKLDLQTLGYFKRISESAVQYAERLLSNKENRLDKPIEIIVSDLVYSYKDHSFVIDIEEAQKLLGDLIKTDTEEYKLGKTIFEFLEEVTLLMNILQKKDVSLIGGADSFIFHELQ